MGAPVLIGILASLLAGAALARELTPAEKRIYPHDTAIPVCDDLAVLNKIASRFAEKEAAFWQSSLRVVHYEDVRPIGWRPWGLDFIPRLFCTGQVLISDGVRRRIDYSVREDLGIIGATWGVEWCIVGLDRNWAFSPACKMARP